MYYYYVPTIIHTNKSRVLIILTIHAGFTSYSANCPIVRSSQREQDEFGTLELCILNMYFGKHKICKELIRSGPVNYDCSVMMMDCGKAAE